MIMNAQQELEEKYKAERAYLELKFVDQERKLPEARVRILEQKLLRNFKIEKYHGVVCTITQKCL